MKGQGVDVPAVSVSVKGDSRTVFQPEKQFTKTYKDYIEKIEKEYGLTVTEKGIIYTLISYINYEDNLLRLPSGSALIKKDLYQILDLAHNAVDKYITVLVKKGILGKVKVERHVNYYLNPYIAYRGVRIDKTLLDMFEKVK